MMKVVERIKVTEKIKFGLPRGSLNDPIRGNTESLLRAAGYLIRGYTPKKERGDILSISNDPEIKLSLIRPQNTPGDLVRGLIDIAIVGDDWIKEEWNVSRLKPVKLTGLEYGTVQIIAAVPNDFAVTELSQFFISQKGVQTIWYAEYPKLAQTFFLQDKGYKQLYGNKAPVIEIRGLTAGKNDKVQLIYSEGTTEEYIKKGFPIIDAIQSGASLRQVGGRVLENGIIMSSSAGLYARPELEKDGQLWSKAMDIKDKLIGAVSARKYYDVKFNMKKEGLKRVINYIYEEKLILEGPTPSPILGQESEIKGFALNITVPVEKWPEVSRKLKNDYGATGLETDTKKYLNK